MTWTTRVSEIRSSILFSMQNSIETNCVHTGWSKRDVYDQLDLSSSGTSNESEASGCLRREEGLVRGFWNKQPDVVEIYSSVYGGFDGFAKIGQV